MLKRLLILVVLSLALGQLIALSKSNGFNVYLFDLLVPIFDMVGIIYLLIHRSFKIPKYLFFFIVFSGIALISLAPTYFNLSFENFLISFSYWFRFVMYIFSGVIVFNMLTQKIITPDELLNLLLFSGVLISVGGFIQLILLPDLSILDPSLGWDPHMNRLASTFYDPNFVGAYLTLCLTLIFNRWFDLKKLKFDRYLAIFLVLVPALVLTFSRSSWLMFGVVVLVYGLLRSRKLLLLAGLIAFLAYFAVPRIQTRISGVTDPADSASYRLVSWQHTLEIIKDNILLGVGFNTYRYAQIEYGFINSGDIGGNSGAGSDASLLLVFATTGIIGFSAFVFGMLYPIFNTSFKNSFILSVVFGLLLESTFINSLFYPQILFIMVMIFAMCSVPEFKNYS